MICSYFLSHIIFFVQPFAGLHIQLFLIPRAAHGAIVV